MNEISHSLNTLIENDLESIKQTILLVDDEENNLQLLKRTLRGSYNIKTATNGKDALEIIKNDGENISLVVSDQKMPEMEGTEFLKHVNEINPDIVKILLTGHQDTDIIVASINDCQLYQYILKPFEPEELKVSIKNGLKKYELSSNRVTIMRDLKELFYKTIKSISLALDAKDSYTNGHSLRVTLYSLILANNMNLSDEVLEEIETAGLLHDIGKIGIPHNILCKPGKLTDEEFEIMKKHPEQGEKMIMNIKKLKIIANWLKTHHERWDGKGYPLGLKGEEIPISARIIALADTYDAMTSTRPYRKSLPHEVAIAEIQKCSGTQFDPQLAEMFVSLQDTIKAAKENPEEFYNKYSYLRKYLTDEVKSIAS
ncbi:MAG: HD domain-containing protein [Candidatus Gastranaerophilales bacterium]|nr:HD domain-containing protein [Candidatus Gastranaerophilales bacterium]